MFKNPRIINFIFLILFLVLCYPSKIFAGEVTGLADKIAFLRKGEVWVADKDGHHQKPITNIEGKVKDFLFSPGGRYLVYSKVAGFKEAVEFEGEEEKIYPETFYSITILDLKNQKILKEIRPQGDTIYLAKWLGDEKLLFYEAHAMAVNGFFEYEVSKNKEQEIDYIQGSRASDSDYHPDGSLMVYVDDTGLGPEFREHLHLVDLKSKKDKIVVSKRSILMPRISYDKKYIAWVEVEQINRSQYIDNLWIYNIKEGSLKNLYRGPALPKTGFQSRIAWSSDYKFIAMFCASGAVVLEIQDPGNIHKISGIDFNWLGDNKILFAQGNSIYRYRLDSKKRELFLNDASQPKFLRSHV